ncbi:MAG: circadian clock KaiB family protein [Solirubrobacteraceae bacterium]|jgi:circadian clock protein KaiB
MAAEQQASSADLLVGGRYELRLYVAGATSLSARAIEAIQEVCREHLEGNYDLEIIDIYQVPRRARADDIVATPTLVKSLPKPVERLVGDLSDRERVLMVLSLRNRG